MSAQPRYRLALAVAPVFLSGVLLVNVLLFTSDEMAEELTIQEAIVVCRGVYGVSLPCSHWLGDCGARDQAASFFSQTSQEL